MDKAEETVPVRLHELKNMLTKLMLKMCVIEITQCYFSIQLKAQCVTRDPAVFASHAHATKISIQLYLVWFY